MQFDFLKQLLGVPRTTRATPPVVEPRLKQPTGDPLLLTARELLINAGAPGLAERVRIEWNARMRSTAGYAFPAQALVRLNPKLLAFGDEEVDRTLRHELAHLLAHERAGKRRIEPHGAEWRRACRDLGLPGEKRTHDLPLPRRTVARRHHYRCAGCGTIVARVKPLTHGAACLRCCRTYNGGRYDARFRFERVAPPA